MRSGRSLVLVAVIAAAVVAGALGAYRATLSSAWRWPDEQAHTGYAVALGSGDLPRLDTPIRVLGSRDAALHRFIYETWATDDGTVDPHTQVWVANHPPGGYVLAMPAVAVFVAADRGDLVLLSLRLSAVVGLMAVVLLTAGLAFEVTGRRSAAALAAALVSTSPYLGYVSSTASSDAWSWAAVLGMAWACKRAVDRSWDRRSTVLVAVAASACGLTRIASLGTALALGVVALAISWRRGDRPRMQAPLVAAAVALTSGWWWVRNAALYGDPAGSSELLERFHRHPRGMASAATDVDMWWWSLRSLFGARYDVGFGSALPFSTAGTVAAVVVAVSLVIVVLRRDGDGAAWALVATAAVATWLGAVQHTAGGGNPWGRYLAVVALAAAIVVAAAITGFRQAIARAVLLGAVLIAGFWWRFDELRGMAQWAVRHGQVGPGWGEPGFGPSPLRWVLAGLAVAAAITAVVSSILLSLDPGRRRVGRHGAPRADGRRARVVAAPRGRHAVPQLRAVQDGGMGVP